ncbi:MAG TPA: energy transducer TonB [Holophagaceae bacterium]|nr:energy transducer TonB [Holophagaceae bacterium]
MSTHAHDGGLRPALPPTLQPMALALAAPRTDKRTALAASALVYLLLPAAVVALGRVLPVPTLRPMPTKVDDTIYLPVERTVTLDPPGGPAATPAVAAVNPGQLALPSAPLPREEENLENLVPSATLPGSFTSHQAVGTSTDPRGGGDLRPPANPGVVGTGIGNGAPVQVDASALRILHQEVPVYPALARVAHVQGDVLVRMVIDAQGVPTSVQVEQGHPALRAAAEQSARLWRFTAAQVNGHAVPATFLLTLKFRLH